MAWLESTFYEFFEHSTNEHNELVVVRSARAPIKDLPQIYWEDGSPWDEANAWSLHRAAPRDVDIQTVKRTMKHVCRYATYLEEEGLDWRHFPLRKDERVLWKFRRTLIQERDEGILEGSTAASCMSAVIMFYRFADVHNLVGAIGPMWENRSVTISINDRAGFKRTIVRTSTDLKIKNVKRVAGVRLEEGLLPLRADDMTSLINYSAMRCTVELHLMLSTGFFTGARVGTVVTLTVSSPYTAREIAEWPGVFHLPVGPGTNVATKSSVKGNILFPRRLLNDLKAFATSTERLKREVKARPEDKNVLFLTRSGRPYSTDKVGSLIRALRKEAIAEGMQFMQRFKFHDSRATFGSNLIGILLDHLPPSEALGIVKDAMLHKEEKVTFGYIKFRERNTAKEKANAAYHEAFTGRRHVSWDKQDA